MGSLALYNRKRNFDATPEPSGKSPRAGGRTYVVQKHAARRLHYDFRLEHGGVLWSWAVPKGPSLDPRTKRLAVRTEDHPVSYASFEGTIPKGQYGGGKVEIWDRGRWEPVGDPDEGMADGKLRFRVHGERLKGEWVLIRTRGGDKESWILKKIADDHAGAGAVPGGLVSPMPARIEPQLATLAREIPPGEGWLHELKLDGYRLVSHVDGKNVRVITRGGHDWSERLGPVVSMLGRLAVDSAILDGELVVLNEEGLTDFQLLQNALSAEGGAPLRYHVFDLPYLNGADLRRVPLADRKALLEELVRDVDPKLRYCDHFAGDGARFLAEACKRGAEGIITKRADAQYQSGRSRSWLKLKCTARQEVVVVGWTDPGGSRQHLGALLVGLYEGEDLRFAGKVGTGFNEKSLGELSSRLNELEIPRPPVVDPPRGYRARGTHWVKPVLVAQVSMTGFTGDGKLRHPVFEGLRDDKPPTEVTRERPVEVTGEPPTHASAGNPTETPASAVDPLAALTADAEDVLGRFRLTNPDKVLYPDDGITKRDVVLYLARVARWMLPHVTERPLTLVRCPEGHTGECFYQKHAHKGLPAVFERLPIRDKEGKTDYLSIRGLEGLLATAQMGALELHPWGSRSADFEHPDVLIFDLDPDEELGWDRVAQGAFLVRDILRDLSLTSFVKTTGGKGLHVVVPVTPGPDWPAVKSFTKSVADAIGARHPKQYLSVMTKARRTGKIFVDYLRNGRGATAVAPYSLRARPGAPVATPITWDELAAGITPADLNLFTVPDRLVSLPSDPWHGFFDTGQTLTDGILSFS